MSQAAHSVLRLANHANCALCPQQRASRVLLLFAVAKQRAAKFMEQSCSHSDKYAGDLSWLARVRCWHGAP